MNPLAAEKAGAKPLLQGDIERHRFFRAEKCFLAADQGLTGVELHRQNRAGKTRGESDMSRPLRGKIGDEETAAAEAAFDAGKKAAARMGRHRDRIIHPAHAIGLAEHGFAGIEIDRERLHHGAGELVSHFISPIR